MAVACYHCQRGNARGARGQFTKGLRKLAAYLPECEGIDTKRLYRDAQALLHRVEAAEPLGEFPCIRTASGTQAATAVSNHK